MRHTHQKRRNEREGHVERCKTTQEKQEQRERRDGENMQRMREAEASRERDTVREGGWGLGGFRGELCGATPSYL